MKYKIIFIFSFFCFSFCQAQTVPIITTIAGNGTRGYSGDGGQATAAQLYFPSSVALDTIGNIYIGDAGNHVIRKVSPSGIIITFAGNDTFGYSGDGGPATNAKISGASSFAFDKKGNVYFFDMGNFVIRKVDTLGIITTIAGNHSNHVTGDGGLATAAGIDIGGGFVLISLGIYF